MRRIVWMVTSTFLAIAIVAACSDDPASVVATLDASGNDGAAVPANEASVAPVDAGMDAGGPDGCVPCGGECVLVDSDPNHCGACGHVCGCGATTCTAGQCDPTTLAAAPGAAPYELTLNDGQLFWAEDVTQKLRTMPATGGDAGVLFTSRTLVRGIALTPTKILFGRAVFNIVELADRTGGGSRNFTNHQENGVGGVVIDGDRAFWVNTSTGVVRTKVVVADSTDGTTLATGQTSASRVAADATSVYWTTHTATGAVMKMPREGGTPVALASNQNLPYDIEVDDSFVYWTNSGEGSISKVPKAGGAVQVLATGRAGALMLSIDGTYAYYGTSSTVEKVPLAGGPPVTLAAKEAAPAGLAIDDHCVYFANNGADGGAIRSVAK